MSISHTQHRRVAKYLPQADHPFSQNTFQLLQEKKEENQKPNDTHKKKVLIAPLPAHVPISP